MGPVYLSGVVAYLLVVWFKTNGVWTYFGHLLGPLANKFTFYRNFRLMAADIPGLLFVEYLRNYHSGFIVSLLSCPICISLWIALLSLPWIGIGSFTGAFLGLLGFSLWSTINANADQRRPQ